VTVGPAPASGWQFAAAAGLAAGPGAALSHNSAARALRLPVVLPDNGVEVTVPRHRHPVLPGARVHRSSI
jgi:hypothetical protein